MIRALLVPLALGAPISVFAQDGPSPWSEPRAITYFADVTGDLELAQPDRYGSFAEPAQNELGLFMLIRRFRHICLTLEGGASLDAVMPDGYAAYGWTNYVMGTDGAGDAIVLSPTGSIDIDEVAGHPTIWLNPSDGGMSCELRWEFEGGLPDNSPGTFFRILEYWLPWEWALVRATRPSLNAEPLTSNAVEWDRPCGDRWCPVTVIYGLARPSIIINAQLNITAIEGARP